MAQATPKITLSVSRDTPFNKLVLSDSNVRRTKAGVAIEQLADPETVDPSVFGTSLGLLLNGLA